QVGRQAVLADGEGNRRQIFAELLLELNHIAHVIDALIEAPGELGGDGLYRNLLVGDGGQDDQQFRRGLRRIGLVHRNLGDELAAAASSSPRFRWTRPMRRRPRRNCWSSWPPSPTSRFRYRPSPPSSPGASIRASITWAMWFSSRRSSAKICRRLPSPSASTACRPT